MIKEIHTEADGQQARGQKRPLEASGNETTSDSASEGATTVVNYNMNSCIFGPPPLSDLVSQVAKFVEKFANLENIEIEGKLGLLIDNSTQQRVDYGVGSECVIRDTRNTTFMADVSAKAFERLNKALNERTARSRADPSVPEIEYTRRKITDKFYRGMHKGVRVSFIKGTDTVVECIRKHKLEHLNIHLPNAHHDIRITAAQEIKVPQPEPGTPVNKDGREKDRINYRHGLFAFDLTKVEVESRRNGRSVSWEMEVEITDIDAFLAQHALMKSKRKNNFLKIVESFLNNLRWMSFVPRY